jgi:hypothetical protein
MDAMGTTNALIFEASGGTFPYSYPGYISFTFNESWQSAWYGLFYDWKISVGGACGRTPVEAILDPANKACSCATTQTIALQKGWNLISTNVDITTNTIESVFTGLDVEQIKTANSFWLKGQAAPLNQLQTIEAGYGYFVKMNVAGTLTIIGLPHTGGWQCAPTTGWNLIGCPFQTATPFSTYFNATNTQTIKNFEGFWIPNDALSSITNLVPGKGYYLKK